MCVCVCVCVVLNFSCCKVKGSKFRVHLSTTGSLLQKPYIPYRDSKLTRVLQESLGGNARTTLVICCSPSSFNQSETKSTLMFGDRAKTVKNVVAVNVELTAEEWRQRYEKQRAANSQLKALVDRYEKELQRWRRGDSVPPSEQASGKVRQDATAASSPLLAPPPSNAPATPTPAEVRAFEEDRAKLYQQLDEKVGAKGRREVEGKENQARFFYSKVEGAMKPKLFNSAPLEMCVYMV